MGDLFDAEKTFPGPVPAPAAAPGERLQICGICRHGVSAAVGVPRPDRTDIPLDWIK